jgi:transposase InsO family protein
MQAVLLVRKGWGVRRVARYTGVSPGTISKWCAKAPPDGRLGIPTKSSKPHHSPKRLPEVVRDAIFQERLKHHRCSAVVQRELQNQGILVSLSTVHRVLDEAGQLKKRSKWKRYHKPSERPLANKPGELVEIDTIHLVPDVFYHDKTKIYIYTIIDVHSRWAYARAYERANTWSSLDFLERAKQASPFPFGCLQSDNGPEFSTYFTENAGINHRHTRVRKPNDNAHIERFNRTLQEECFKHHTNNITEINQWIEDYLDYYNNQRLHMGINFLTPHQKLTQVFPRS